MNYEPLIKLIQQEWYRLNNLESPQDPRELGILLGRKAQCNRLIHIIQELEDHYNEQQNFNR